jgi:hypothetical protein
MSEKPASGKTPVRAIFWEGAIGLVAACKNPISIFGILLVAFTTLAMFSFWAFAISGTGVNRYLEVLFYLILPGVFGFGLLVVAVGV